MKSKIIMSLFTILIIILLLYALIYFAFLKKQSLSPKPLEYRNNQYGFTFSLPDDWRGYKEVIDKWEGYEVNNTDSDNKPSEEGPLILIRNPNWTEQNPHQDIPIMVFTLNQWKKIQQGELSVSAAPIPPTELDRNSKYVFSLPARYNYAYQIGWEEVANILGNNSLKAFEP